jgi:hypothetical protein
MRFEVSTAVIMKNAVFWDVTDIPEERIASLNRVKLITELGNSASDTLTRLTVN